MTGWRGLVLITRLLVVFALLQMVSFAMAQDTVFVPCRTGSNQQVSQSRIVKGPIVSSATGNRAYVTVNARVVGSACSNVTQLYVAGPAGEFKKVYEAQPMKTDDGNGMRLVGWNRSGTKLMAELGRFTYGTDTGMSTEVIVYDATASKVSHFDVEAALAKHFGEDCAFVPETEGWLEPDSAAVRVREYKEDWDENRKSCVQRLTQFAVNLSTGAVSAMPRR